MAAYGGIELGGTKCVCAVGDGSDDTWAGMVIPTTDPETTTQSAIDWFREVQEESGPLVSLGVASFGPLDLAIGAIAQATPKVAWRGWPVVAKFEQGLGVRANIDTDVNAAALAEQAWGAAQGCSDVLYVTVGTGIGVGAIVNGALVHGRSHPEAGHMRFPQHPADRQPGSPGQMWTGNCPFHGTCWEGLASGPARAQRSAQWAQALEEPPDALVLESEYIALGLVNLISTFRPQRIILSGGVMHEAGLMRGVRRRTRELLDESYFPEALEIDDLVVAPALGDAAGVVGAVLLAAELRPGYLRSRPVGHLVTHIEQALTRT
ncbi:MAG: ROK family protein [Acidimicrobiales bacterium]